MFRYFKPCDKHVFIQTHTVSEGSTFTSQVLYLSYKVPTRINDLRIFFFNSKELRGPGEIWGLLTIY
jgi:hypothetical protein